MIIVERIIDKALRALCAIYECFNFTSVDGHYPLMLPPDVITELQTHTDTFLSCCQWLRNHFKSEDRKLFNLVSKHHTTYHIALEANYNNPRCSWCYVNEDWVGRFGRIGHSTRHGMAAAHRSHAIYATYIRGMALEMKHTMGDTMPFVNVGWHRSLFVSEFIT